MAVQVHHFYKHEYLFKLGRSYFSRKLRIIKSQNMPKPFLVLVLLFHCYEIQGYGYRYNFNPGTGESNLWTFLPGHEQPVVYSYSLGMFPGVDWPHVYSVPYDGLLPGQGVIPGLWATDPHLYRYKAPDGKFKYKCKPDAFWSELQYKCIWKPSYYVKKRLQQQQG